MKETLKVAVLQFECTSDKNENFNRSLELIRESSKIGAKLIVLPELHLTQYFCQVQNPNNFDLAEDLRDSFYIEGYSNLAKELEVVIVTSMFEKRARGLYHNTAVVFDTDGSIAGIYRKMHIPDDPGYNEKYYFTPGDLGFKPIETSIGKLGVLICWDQWFPEPARLMALAGADILIYPTAIGWDPNDNSKEKEKQLNAWKIAQLGHAIYNSLHVISCNRVGFEENPIDKNKGIEFWGNSFIAGPQGEILEMANEKNSAVVVKEIDFSKTEKIRRPWPFLRDRRIEWFADLINRFID
jgi:N-carbamoylputrescine amidase